MRAGSFWRRVWRAARLDPDVYEEVEAEPSALRQAALVVLLASVAGALGSALGGWLDPEPGTNFRVLLRALEPFVLWLGGSVFAYMVGATFFSIPDTETDYSEVLRTVGFAFGPGLLRLLAFVPPPTVGFAVERVAELWMLLAGVVAVRQALDFTTLRAIATFGTAYLLLLLLLLGLSVVPLPIP